MNNEGNSPVDRPPVSISATRVAAWVFGVAVVCELFFVWADYALNYSRGTPYAPLRRFFNIAREDGVASWFGTTQTMLIALTFLLLHLGERIRPDASRLQRAGWLALACFFGYMAFDDGTEFHERMGSVWKAMRSAEGSSRMAGWGTLFPSYDWQFLFLPLFGAAGLFMAWFLWRELDWRAGRAALAASVGLLAVAVGLDFIEGLQSSHPLNLFAAWGRDPDVDAFAREHFRRSGAEAVRHFAKSLEEFFEMFAQTVLWAALIVRTGRRGPAVFRVEP